MTTLSSFFTESSPMISGQFHNIFCYVPRLPLLAGHYRLDLWCATANILQDELMDARLLEVEPGNYFGVQHEARLPIASRHGAVVVPQNWSTPA